MPLPRSSQLDLWKVLRRFLWIGAFAYWVGGFTFYGSVVIPNGSRVVAGGEAEFGFVTRLVTNWLNLIGAFALTLFATDAFVQRRLLPRWLRLGQATLLVVLVVCQLVLIATHPHLDRLLRPEQLEFIDRRRFRHLHKLYIGTATLQWGASVAYLLVTLLAWQWADRSCGGAAVRSEQQVQAAAFTASTASDD